MAQVTVVGAQWGDEGKGKIVDWLSSRAEVIVRFQGGHNAGHTLVIGNKVFKLSLLPSGVVREGKLSIIGNGVVVDPWALLDEMARVSEQGVNLTPKELLVSDQAHIILPIHSALDKALEVARGKSFIGTTGRGIGPAYEDKVARRGVRLCDLKSPEQLKEKLDFLFLHHNALLKGLGAHTHDANETFQKLMDIAPKIIPYLGVAWRVLDEQRSQGKHILFEGAQGALLDVDHGTYPFVTSSNTVAGAATVGSGLGGGAGYVLGLAKAYTTRVGSGPFPTEQENDIGETLGQKGHEFGVVTGRKRRCGWFDAVLVRQAVKVGGIKGIALTKLDILDGFAEVKVCTGYKLDGAVIDYFPSDQASQDKLEPIYETHEGWPENSSGGARSWVKLHANAIKYVKRLEELVGVPVSLLSTSPERDDTIVVTDPFEG